MASVTLGQHPVSPVSQQHHNISDSETRESFFLRKLLRKPSREKLMLTRGSSSLDGESARSPIAPISAAAAASSSLSCSQPLITENGGGGGPLDSRCCTNGSLQLQTPRSSSTDNDNAAVATAAEDNGNLLVEEPVGARARCQEDSMLVAANGSQFGPTGLLINTNRDVTTETQENRKEQQSVNITGGEGTRGGGEQLPRQAAKTGGDTAGRRSSLKDTKCSSSRTAAASACANGHLGSGRRLSRKFKSLSTGTPPRGLDLDRVTQGRSGIVRIMRTDPPRREAWSIFHPGADPRVKAERGEGHLFVPKPVAHDWCDACSRHISAAGAVQCKCE